jgi:hypothetical protein
MIYLGNQQKRIALRIAAITRRTNDPTMNLDLIYPEHRRRLPTDFRGNSLPHEPYQPYEQLVIGLGINMSDPKTRQQVPAVAAALPDRTQTERVLKQVAKPLYVIEGVLTKNAIQNMLPDRLRSQAGLDYSTLELTTIGIKAVMYETRSTLIVKKMKPICLYVSFEPLIYECY